MVSVKGSRVKGLGFTSPLGLALGARGLWFTSLPSRARARVRVKGLRAPEPLGLTSLGEVK